MIPFLSSLLRRRTKLREVSAERLPERARFHDSGLRTIDLMRGDTLRLDSPEGATVHLANGIAWLSLPGCYGRRAQAGEAIPINGAGSTLVYALDAVSIYMLVDSRCEVELRRRGGIEPLVKT